MGVEYYIIKPKSKEKFYLGKRIWSCLQGFSYNKPKYIEYENSRELMLELIDTDNYLECYVEQVLDLAEVIYEWCDEPVYIENDCSDSFNEVSDYKETGSILNVWDSFKERYQTLFTLEEELDEIITMIPSEYYVTNKERVIMAIPTLSKYIKESKNDKR